MNPYEHDVEKATFVREYTEPNLFGLRSTYKLYTAPNAAVAKAFLKANGVSRPLLYLVVETPEGNWCRDKDGIYRE